MRIIFSVVLMLIFPTIITVCLDFYMGYTIKNAILNTIHSFSVMEPAEFFLLFFLITILLINFFFMVKKKKKA